MTQATLRPTLAALALLAALWCAPDAGASGMRATDPWAVARPVPAVGDNVTTPLCEGFDLGNSLDASGVAPGRPWWLSRDPLGERGGLNLYGFVGNDPVNKVDYLGLLDLGPMFMRQHASPWLHDPAVGRVQAQARGISSAAVDLVARPIPAAIQGGGRALFEASTDLGGWAAANNNATGVVIAYVGGVAGKLVVIGGQSADVKGNFDGAVSYVASTPNGIIPASRHLLTSWNVETAYKGFRDGDLERGFAGIAATTGTASGIFTITPKPRLNRPLFSGGDPAAVLGSLEGLTGMRFAHHVVDPNDGPGGGGAPVRLFAEDGSPVPFGFASPEEYLAFGQTLREGLPGDTGVVFQGSSVTNRSHEAPYAPFDVGRISDFDIGLVGALFEEASALPGVRVKTQPNRIGPLDDDALESLGLKALRDQMSEAAGGRPVKFMLFDALEEAMRRPSIISPGG